MNDPLQPPCSFLRLLASVLATIALVAAPPALAQESGGEAPTTAPAEKPAPADLPAAEEILERAVEALGGREKLEAVESMSIEAVMSMPAQGMEIQMTMLGAAPNKSLQAATIPGFGDSRTGYDGETGWAIDPMMGARLLEGKELEAMQDQGELFSELRFAERYTEMETIALVDFEGEPCYELRLVKKNGDESTEYYSQETGLQRGAKSKAATAMGEIESTQVVVEYGEFDGVRMPVHMVIKSMMAEQHVRVTKCELNGVDPGAFALPPEIQALLAPEDEDEEGDDEPGDEPAEEPGDDPEPDDGDDG